MASQETITILLDTIKGHWPVFSRNNPNVVRDWSAVCKHLSEKQVKSGRGRMIRVYKGDRPPTPAMFTEWAGGLEKPSETPQIHFKEFFVKVRGQHRDHAVIVQGGASKIQSAPAPYKEFLQRYWGVINVWAGKIKLPNTQEENMRIIRGRDPLDPEVLALRNHNRQALGWPLLNTQGRPVSNV